ncbi:MAG: GNAT family N-acetyltransferase [Methanosarcinaceae archaeon]|nr:GNAT family N-acetyltransferase [Methanosarcinaceae archaeon]
MNTIKKDLLASTSSVVIRPFNSADVDFVISRQLSLYELEHGFTSEIWKAYLTGGVRELVDQFDDERDCMYILDHNGTPSGCAAITHADEVTAKFRFFFVEADLRGMGAGHKLLDMAIDFCKEKGYKHVFLWTFSTLLSARHLYISKGFKMTETQENTEWGTVVLEERWDLDL